MILSQYSLLKHFISTTHADKIKGGTLVKNVSNRFIKFDKGEILSYIVDDTNMRLILFLRGLDYDKIVSVQIFHNFKLENYIK